MIQPRVITAIAAAAACLAWSSAATAQGVTTMQLATLHNIGGMSISPSGRYVVYQVYRANPRANSYSNEWRLLDIHTGKSRIVVADGGSPVLAYEDNTELTDYRDDWASFSPAWSSDDTLYYVRKDRGAITVHRLSTNGGDSLVTGYVGNVFRFRQLDQDRVAISTRAPSTATRAESARLLRDGMLFFDGSRDLDIIEGPPDMTPLLVPHYFQLDLKTGAIGAVAASAETAGEDPETVQILSGDLYSLYLTPSPDGKRRAFIGLQRQGDTFKAGIYLLSADGKSHTKIKSVGLSDTMPVAWSPDSRRLYFVSHSKALTGSEVYELDVATREARQLTTAGAYLYNCSFDADATLAACLHETQTRPTNVALVNLRTGKVSVLTNLNPDFDRSVAGLRMKTYVWTDKYGDMYFGTLTYPRAYAVGKRYPLVFLTYWDQGFQRGASGDEYPIYPLAEQGLFVFNLDCVSFALHDAGVHPPGQLNLKNWDGPLDAMTMMAKRFIAQGLIDPNGIGVGGLSYGSELSLYAASHSATFRAAIGSHGGSYRDPFDYYMKGHRWDETFRSWGLDGPPYGDKLKYWKQLSPALNADRTNAAILMNSNDKEWIPGLQQFWEMRDRHKPVEFWIFSDEQHTKHQPVHRLTIYNRNVDWYKFWLAGKEDPSPAKREQYKRWERLRAMEHAPAH